MNILHKRHEKKLLAAYTGNNINFKNFSVVLCASSVYLCVSSYFYYTE